MGIKKFGILLIIFFSVSLLFSSCGKKSSSLTGTSSGTGSTSGGGSSSLSVSGTVNGGTSPISGASVSLMEAGSTSSLSTAATNSSGQFTLTIPSSASGILYVEALGGSTNGGANNNNIQLLAFVNVGAPSSSISNLVVNELTTSAFMEAMFHFGMVSSAGGTITFTSPANTAAQTNAVTQYNNMVTTSGALNTSNSNLTSSDQNSLYFAADALASCVENSGNCSTMMADTGGASNMRRSLYNLLNTPSEIAGLTTLASGMETSTGWSFSSTPTAVSFILPSAINPFPVGTSPVGLAIDASGNVWVANYGSGNVTELNSSGATLGTFPVGTNPIGLAIDSSGNVWVTNFASSNVTELNSSGAVLGTFPAGTDPAGIAIDSSGNVWVANGGSSNVTELNSSGAVLGTFPAGTDPAGLAIDASGNVWVTNPASDTVTELNSLGTVLSTFTVSAAPLGLAIDVSGNMWLTNPGSNSKTVTELKGITLPQFFPYSGPQYPGSSFSAGGGGSR